MSKGKVISWVHLSDIHIGHSDYVETIMREQLPEFLKTLGRNRNFNLLFITGDLIYSPKYLDQSSRISKPDKIGSLVKAIQNAMGIGNDSTCISIGNHDVVRTIEKNNVIRNILKTYTTEKGEIGWKGYDQILSAENRFSQLYNTILNREYKGGHYVESLRYYLNDEQKTLNILNIDTVISAEAMNETETKVLQDGNLIIGIGNLKEAINKSGDKNLVIATGHHPLTALSENERSAVVQLLQKIGITIYLCGHTHIARIDNIGTDANPLIQICCGTNMEHLPNGESADMVFYAGSFDVEKKQIEVETYQYTHRDGTEWEWHKAKFAPFVQNQFEKDNSITTFFNPKNSAPYYTIIDKMAKSLGKIVGDHEFFVELELESNPKRPPKKDNDKNRTIVEANTGYGKTKYLKNLIYNQLNGVDIQKINDALLKEERNWPFFIDFGRKNVFSKNDAILNLLAKSIHLSLRSPKVTEVFARWINILASSNRLALFIDGLDRLDTYEMDSFSRELMGFLEEHPNVKVVATSKFYVFESSRVLRYYDSFAFLQIKELSPKKIEDYCYKWHENNHELDEEEEDDSWREKAKNIIKQIIQDESLKNLACVPLLLDTMLQLSKETNVLPKNRVQLYESFVYDLLKNEKSPESDIKLLAAIAFEMNEGRDYLVSRNRMVQIIRKVLSECDWLQLNYSDDIIKEADAFLDRMDTKSRILRKDENNYTFYNTEVRDYFTSLALAKGYYVRLKEACTPDCLAKKQAEFPLLRAIEKYVHDIDCGNVLELTILQLNTYETFLIVEKLIVSINDQDKNTEATVVSNSYLRNLLLRVILHGANVIGAQRKRSFAAVLENQKIFGLQAGLLEEVWSSRYSSDFKEQCPKYLLSLFSLLRKQSDPIGYLCNNIKSNMENSRSLEENLYVLDGVFWSKGREYIDVYKEYASVDDFVGLLEHIIKNNKVDLLCKRRAFGVIHRLLEVKAINSFNVDLIPILFHVFEIVPRVSYRDCNNDADKYAGIRVFNIIPLEEQLVNAIKSLTVTEERKRSYKEMFENAQNPQDKLDSFEAAILCKVWTLQEINQIKENVALFKSAIINTDELNTKINCLVQNDFFDG